MPHSCHIYQLTNVIGQSVGIPKQQELAWWSKTGIPTRPHPGLLHARNDGTFQSSTLPCQSTALFPCCSSNQTLTTTNTPTLSLHEADLAKCTKVDPVRGQNLPQYPRPSTKQASKSKEHCQRRVLSAFRQKPWSRRQRGTKSNASSRLPTSRLGTISDRIDQRTSVLSVITDTSFDRPCIRAATKGPGSCRPSIYRHW